MPGRLQDLNITDPSNLEEQALSLVGNDVYEKLVKGYTEKQWGRDCKELPAFIIRTTSASDLLMIIIILMIVIRESRSAAILRIVEKLLEGVRSAEQVWTSLKNRE